MSEDLTPRQQILLWDLVSRGGSALQKDLKFDFEAADRELLRQRRHISVTREKTRAFRLTIEEHGWNHLATSPPTLLPSNGSKYDRAILQFVLSQIQRYIAADNSATIAQLFSAREEESGEWDRDGTASVERQVADAFFAVAGRPARGSIRLSQLRSKLDGVPRDRVDAALIAMWRAKTANLMNLDNPRDIEAECEAALKIGSNTFHVVRIAE